MHDFHDHSYRPCPTASACNHPSENETINTIWGVSDYYNKTQNKALSFNTGKGVFASTCPWPRRLAYRKDGNHTMGDEMEDYGAI